MKRKIVTVAIIVLVFLPIMMLAQPHEGEKGDVNNDGSVNILDVLKVINHILGVEILNDQELWRSDCSSPLGKCTGDGYVNVLDALKIVNIILEIDLCPKAADNVFIADVESGLTLVEIDSTTFTYSFKDSVPSLSPGDVLVDTSGWGHLRKIGSMTIQGNTVIIETEDAALTDAIVACLIDTTVELNLGNGNRGKEHQGIYYGADGVTQTGNRLDFSGTVLYQGNVHGADVQVVITSGYIDFDSQLDIGITIGWSLIDEFHAIVHTQTTSNLDVAITCSKAFSYNYDHTLYLVPGPEIWIPIPIPPFVVILVPTFEFDGCFDVGVGFEGMVGTGFDSQYNASIGARYEYGKWSNVLEYSGEDNFHPPTWSFEAGVTARVYVEPKVNILIYGVVGPYVEAEPYIEFNGAVDVPCWAWELACGIDGELGVEVNILGYELAKYYYPFELVPSYTLAEDSYCPSPPVAVFEVTPEEGTTATVFQVDASGSHDDQDPTSALQVRWQWEGGGLWTSWTYTKTASHQYSTTGTKTITLEVKDTEGLTDTATDQVIVIPIAAPTLNSPENGSTTNDSTPTFEWDDVPGADGYHLMVARNSSFTNLVINNSTLSSSTYTHGSSLSDDTYYWKVKAKDSYNNWGDWSSTWSFTISTSGPPAPTLLSPSNGSTTGDNTPTFDWSDVSGAVAYELQVDNNSSFGSPEISRNNLTSSTHTPSSSLSYGTYYWKVRAKNSLGNWGGWSATWSFTIPPPGPDAPTLISPSNGSTTSDNTPAFDWSDVSGAESYELIVDNNSNFGSPEVHQTALTSSTYTPSSSLSYDTFYWKVGAKDNLDHWSNWSATWSFTISPPGGCGTVTDYDGNTYQTIQIGDQCWMAENLKVTHYRNGDPIHFETEDSEWAGLSTGAYCNYDNNPDHVSTYGRLYNWYAVHDSRNIAPGGWRVPTDDDWKTLEKNLGMSPEQAESLGYRGSPVGGKMKETGFDHWLSPNTGADNESDFTALPNGARDGGGDYRNMGVDASFWSNTNHATNSSAFCRFLNYEKSQVYRQYTGMRDGLAVRLVSDGAGSSYPQASFTVDPTYGPIETIFNVDASGSFDNEDPMSALMVRWDWENDGTFDTDWSTTKTTSHQYTTTGTRIIKLEVKDTGGLIGMKIHQVPVTPPGGGIMTDIDGNMYPTVQIGSQWWMTENLKVTHYRNGDFIPNITSNWSGLTTGAYCNYDNSENNATIYGQLYNWYAVDDPRGLAPAGWHVPNDEEWKQLEKYLGMSQSEADNTSWRGTDEGGKMKKTGTIEGGDGLWYTPNTGATNTSYFSALPGGARITTGYLWLGSLAYFWSTTVHWTDEAWYRHFDYRESRVHRASSFHDTGHSVRCVKN